MSDGENAPRTIDLRRVAAASAVAIGTVAMAAVVYLLSTSSSCSSSASSWQAALQPWHVRLCPLGRSEGLRSC
jgi:hypothetical protein